MAYKFQLGDAIMSGSLRQEEDFRVDGTLDANSSADIAGAVNMQSTLDVAGASTLAAASFSGAIDANSTADFQGDVNLQAALDVAGSSTLADASFSGAIDANSTADFQGDVNLQAALDVAGESTLASATVQDLTSGRLVLAGTSGSLADEGAYLYNTDRSQTNGYTVLEVSSVASGSSFIGDGILLTEDENENGIFSAMVSGINLDVATQASKSITVSGSSDVGLSVNSKYTGGASVLSIGNIFAGHTGGGTHTAHMNSDGSISGSSNLDIGGNGVFAGTLYAAGAVDFDSSADFEGAVNLQSTFVVAGAIDANSTSDFQGAMNLQAGITVAGAADYNSTMDVSGDTKLAAAGVGTQIRGDLTVDEAASFSSSISGSSTLELGGAATIAGDIDANSNVDVAGTLGVAGTSTLADASFSGAIDANSTSNFQGAMILQSTIQVDGDADLNGNVTLGDASGDSVTWNAGSLDQSANALVWTLKDGVDGFSGNGALLMFTGSGGDFLKINTSGSQKGVVFARNFYPSSDDAVDIGASDKEFKDLYLDGVAYVDELQADALGAALNCASFAMTNVNLDSGNIDGTVIGASSQADAQFTTLDASSTLNVDGTATMAAITADGAISFSNSSIEFTAIAETAMDLASDDMYYRDSDGSLKKYSWADLMSDAAGAGISAIDGVLSVDNAVAPSAWSDSGTLSEGLNYAADLSSGAAQSMSLPDSASSEAGDQISVKAAALPGGATMTINAVGSQDIDGASALVLESPYAAVSLVYVGSDKWRIV